MRGKVKSHLSAVRRDGGMILKSEGLVDGMKSLIAIIVCCGGVAVAQPSASWYQGATRCPYLDIRADPVFTLGAGVVFPGEVEGGRDFSLVEFDMQSDFLFFHEVLLGDLDLKLDFSSRMPISDAGLELPDTLMAIAMDGRWTWRYVNDTAFQLRFQPGFYSPVETLNLETLMMPLTFTGIKTVNETLSAVAGISLRYRFERVFMPVAGVVWQPSSDLRVEALLPASRVIWYMMPEWSLYAGWAWESMTYQMPEDDFDRRRVTLESSRVSVGVTREISSEFRVSTELGVLNGRSIEFARGGDLDVDAAPYLRITMGGAF